MITEDSDSYDLMKGRMEQVDRVRKHLETAVQLSFRENGAYRESNRDQQKNYLMVFGLLQTLEGLQERIAMDLATGKKKPGDSGNQMFS